MIVPAVRSQAPPPRFEFETTSVKPNPSRDMRNARLELLPGGRLVIQGVPLGAIVALAYDLPIQSDRVKGGPEWHKMMGELYDIQATASKEAFPSDLSKKESHARERTMLQALLADRFKMKMRIDNTEQPVYALVVAGGGPKLQRSETKEQDCDQPPKGTQLACHKLQGGQGRGLHGDAVTMADVVKFVQSWTDKPMVDETGLTALYNVQTEGWIPMRPRPLGPDGTATTGGDAGIYDPDRQTLFDVFRQLGLKMETRRAKIDLYYVEHIEQPTPN
jgi:uncharacterized protein (TIGR03435 family)